MEWVADVNRDQRMKKKTGRKSMQLDGTSLNECCSSADSSDVSLMEGRETSF